MANNALPNRLTATLREKYPLLFSLLFFLSLGSMITAQPQFGLQSAMNSYAATDTTSDWRPQIAIGNGVWISFWNGDYLDPVTSLGDNGDIFFSRSTDGGHTWSASAIANKLTGQPIATHVEATAQPTTDGAGHWVLVFQWSVANPKPNQKPDWDIGFSTSSDSGITWTTPSMLYSDIGTFWNDTSPRVTMDTSGHCLVVWRNDVAAYCSTSSDYGATWAAPQIIGNPDCTYPIIKTNNAGRWVVAFSARNQTIDGQFIGGDTDITIRISDDNGATWGAQKVVNSNALGGGQSDNNPYIMYDGSNRWAIIWESCEEQTTIGGSPIYGTDPDIMISRSFDNGVTWTPAVIVNTTAATDTGFDRSPSIASDRIGRWIAVWESSEANINGQNLASDLDILLSESRDFGATWTAPRAANSNAVFDNAGLIDDWEPEIATDAQGNWTCVWCSGNALDEYDIAFATADALPETPTPTPSATPTLTTTPTQTETPTETPTPTVTPTFTLTPTATETPTETPTPTSTSTDTPGPAPTETPTPTPTETPTRTPTETPTETPTPAPTTTPVGIPTPTPTATSTETPTFTPTPTETPTEIPTPTDTLTPTATPTQIPTAAPTPTPTPTASPTATDSPTATATETASPTETLTPTPTFTPIAAPTSAPTATPTETPSFTPIPTATATPTATPTASPTATATQTPTPPPTETPTPTATATQPPALTATPTATPTHTFSPTPAFTPTSTIAPAPTQTASPSATATPTPTSAPVIIPPTATPTKTATPIPTRTPTSTATPTPRPTFTKTPTPTATATATPTATPTKTATPTRTPTQIPPPTPAPTSTQTPLPTATPTPQDSNPNPTPTPTPNPNTTVAGWHVYI